MTNRIFGFAAISAAGLVAALLVGNGSQAAALVAVRHACD
jgi:hypothetical protein